MALENIRDLDIIFGSESKGDTPEERALSSSRIFVRSQVQLAEDTPEATGRRLSAWEALQAFGMPKLREVFEHGSAILSCVPNEPARTLANRRKALGLSTKIIASTTGLTKKEVEEAENPKILTSIHIISKIAQALALDEQSVSFVSGANGDPKLAARLKGMGGTQFSPVLVSQLCEVAWVARKQYDLYSWVYSQPPIPIADLGFAPSDNYGAVGYPDWKHGYWLAGKARQILGIAPERPIECMRELIENKLQIPLVQTDLPKNIAGATVINGPVRGIAANTRGDNSNVWVRRMTLAHELGHLLYDPDQELEKLQVDKYSDLQKDPRKVRNHIEARANAFAVEFLAPQKAVEKLFRSKEDYSSGLRSVMETFGLSYTSAQYHVWNACNREMPLEALVVEDYRPTDEWSVIESFATDYFKPDSVPKSRRGRFACFVLQAADKKLLTEQSAASYLRCGVNDYMSNIDVIRDICGA